MNNLELENIIGYHFKNKDLLIEALTHPSYQNEHMTPSHNQRLEFLGDAVLELCMSTYLYHKYISFDEGDMTKKRSQAVREEALYIYASEIHLEKYILLGHGEEQSGGRERPSLVSDAFEAVLGAVYEDGGFLEAKKVFDKIVLPYIDEVVNIKDYKTYLQELVRTDKMNLEYIIVKEEGPAHNKTFEAIVKLNDDIILGRGVGKSKKDAEQMAAKQALDICQKNNIIS